MCGIAGALALESRLDPSDRDVVRAMTGMLRHRGPSAQRVFWDDDCALGNARLSVVDPSDKAAEELGRLMEQKAAQIAVEAQRLSQHAGRRTVMRRDVKMAKRNLER